jgi:hypothetical protein
VEKDVSYNFSSFEELSEQADNIPEDIPFFKSISTKVPQSHPKISPSVRLH